MDGAVASFWADATCRRVFCLRKMASAVWGMTQHRDLAAVPSVLFPEPPTRDSPQASLFHSALLLLESSVSECKQHFVSWPFKSLSASSVFSPWQTETLLLFTAGCFLGFFWPLLLEVGTPAWGLGSMLLRGKSWQLKYSSRLSAAILGRPSSFLVPSPHALPVSLWWSIFFFCLSLVIRFLSN